MKVKNKGPRSMSWKCKEQASSEYAPLIGWNLRLILDVVCDWLKRRRNLGCRLILGVGESGACPFLPVKAQSLCHNVSKTDTDSNLPYKIWVESQG